MHVRFASLLCLVLLALGAVFSGERAHAATINGRVFEDVNYGGGAGRSLAASGGVGISDVRIEVYSGNTYVTDFNTGTNGTFSYEYNGSSPRTLRVVNGTVRSSRGTGTCTTCVPVQTFRTTGATNSNTVTPVTNRVGGENPALNDAPSNTSRATLSSLTTATQRPQSIATVDPSTGDATIDNVDFGFNFSTIVNTRDAAACTPSGSGNSYFPCQGTLRQFLINSAALNPPASQSGSRRLGSLTTSLPAGFDTSIFMIPTSGTASITLATALPTITRDNLRLDATTQTVNIGNTNSGTAGSGGTVGALATSFPFFQRPEVEIAAATFNFTGLNQAIHGFALPRGSITMSGVNAVVQDNFVGIGANGNVDSGTAMAIVFSGANTRIVGNYASANNSVIRGNDPGAGANISFNEVIRPSSTPTDTFDGILLIGSASNARIENNLARNQAGAGIELGFGGGSMNGVVITNNTVRQNGFSGAGTTPSATPSNEPVGIAAWNYTGSNNEISFNLIEDNAGPGVMLSAASGTRLSQNRFSNNRGLSIDLYPTSVDPNTMGTGNGPTLNDSGDGDSGANDLLNFPVITGATILNGEFSIAGFARPGSSIELYVAQPDPSGFGEGFTYLGTVIEGSSADLDGTTGSYSGTINGLNQGSDTTNRFLFRMPLPAGVSASTVLTSTATLGGQTSEFGGNVTVTGGPNLIHSKSVRVESDPFNNTNNPKSIPGSIQVYTIRITNQAGGTVDTNSIEIVDSIPANTAMCGLGGAAVTFVNGTPSSGLTFNAANNVSYSTTASGVPVWGYTPSPDASGCDTAIRHVRIRPQGAMAGSNASGSPYFEVAFRVRVL